MDNPKILKDIEDINPIIHGVKHLKLNNYYDNIEEKYKDINIFMEELIDEYKQNNYNVNNFFKNLKVLEKKYRLNPKKSLIIYLLKKRYSLGLIDIKTCLTMLSFLKTKTCRSLSGILEVAIMTSPGNFSCNENCYYCPDQKGFPRSYIKEEPAVLRAAQNDFDAVKQVHTRLTSYTCNGHDPDKIEYIILGGTWSNYPLDYQEEFMRDLYYAVNIWFSKKPYRKRYSLEIEKKINETTLVKVIGLTVETRPDYITIEEIQRYIKYGVTRVQLGIQTIDDKILKKINRGCYTKDTINALELLMNYGFKILIHIMPNLPTSTPEIDKYTFNELVENPDLQADEWKIYPTSVTTTSEKDNSEVYTVIEKWYKDGKYIPYSNEELMDVIMYAKQIIPNHIRISRIFRDIPLNNIVAGADIPNMRQVLQEKMAKNNEFCKCIRCREIKNTEFNMDDVYYTYKEYKSKNCKNYFISANINPPKNPKNPYKSTLIGFLKLSIKIKPFKTLEVLDNASIVRELHIYGKMIPTYIKDGHSNTQHKGIGSKLLQIAEKMTIQNNLNKISIISGVGVRNFYRKNGYILKENYMTKNLDKNKNNHIFIIFIVIFLILAYILKLFKF